jgi:tetratricopeptide (TPR) repeat protein
MKYMSVIILIFLSACGASAASYNNQGNKSYESEQYNEALNSYTAAKQEDPNLPEPYYNSGNTFYRQGDLDAAGLQLQEALRSQDDELAQKSFYNLGNAYFKQEDWMGAIDAYRQALLLDPDDAQAKYNLELALQNLFQQQAAQQQQQQQGQNEQQQPTQGGGQQPNQQPQQPQPGEGEEPEGGGEGEQQDEESGQNDQPQEPQPSQGQLSPDEAKQLLDALGQDSQTLQERLQQQFGGPALPPQQDW